MSFVWEEKYMNSFLKSLKSTLYDRISSPLSGAFILSWMLWNWKTALHIWQALFSSKETLANMIFRIEGLYSGSWWYSVSLLLVLPFLSACFFIFIYPHISKVFYEYSLEQTEKMRNIKQGIENQRLLTVEDSREILENQVKLENHYIDLMKNKEVEATRLKAEIQRVMEDNNSLRIAFNSLQKKTEDEDKQKIPLPNVGRQDNRKKEWEKEYWSNDNIIVNFLTMYDRLFTGNIQTESIAQGPNNYISPSMIVKFHDKGLITDKPYKMTDKGRYMHELHISGRTSSPIY